jgi:hypothetical protein
MLPSFFINTDLLVCIFQGITNNPVLCGVTKKSKQSLTALSSSLATRTDETAYYPKRGYDMNTIQFSTKADNIEHLLCLTVLIASEKFLPTATLSEADEYYDNLGPQGCKKCLLVNRCMATIINQ